MDQKNSRVVHQLVAFGASHRLHCPEMHRCTETRPEHSAILCYISSDFLAVQLLFDLPFRSSVRAFKAMLGMVWNLATMRTASGEVETDM